MIDTLSSNRIPIKLWAPINEIEYSALTQLRNVANLEIVEDLCAMPDIHAGVGATVGSVIVTRDALIPSAVGVDISCGMCAVKTSLSSLELKENHGFKEIRKLIEEVIPTGNGPNGSFPSGYNINRILKRIYKVKNDYEKFWDSFDTLDKGVQDLEGKARHQCGTLGGGNHFIELCADSNDEVWIMLHSGSRNIGKCIAEIYIKLAKKLQKLHITDPNLSYLSSNMDEFHCYVRDASWAQDYAAWNRLLMLEYVKEVLEFFCSNVKFGLEINCHHNYFECMGDNLYITRKGAISARTDEFGIIPGSMGERSYIVKGLGCEESRYSASHGAGRAMSRTAAKKMFTQVDIDLQTLGVECRKDIGIVDELPKAYKDIDVVMEHQKDLVKPLVTLKQFICVKG